MGQQLLTVLSEMIKLHEKLIAISERKHEALVERDMDGLTEVMKSEKDLLQKLRMQEEKRQELTGELVGDTQQTLERCARYAQSSGKTNGRKSRFRVKKAS